MNTELKAGDLVDLMPYDEVRDHLGISRGGWERACSSNPHRLAHKSWSAWYIDDREYVWPEAALTLHEETCVDLDDLI